uniref:Uncharacterized protein n=1 Tax=Glossina brevipalpis TaxID=37001 RepID=A0A1A9WWL4_9MUSC
MDLNPWHTRQQRVTDTLHICFNNKGTQYKCETKTVSKELLLWYLVALKIVLPVVVMLVVVGSISDSVRQCYD